MNTTFFFSFRKMAALNRRESFKSTLVRLNNEAKHPNFEQASMIKCKEMSLLVAKTFDKFTDEHLTILETVVDDEGMKVQEEAAASTEAIYLEARYNIQKRIDVILDEEVARDLELSREPNRGRNRNNGEQSNTEHSHSTAISQAVQPNNSFGTNPMYRPTEPRSKLERMKITVFSGEQTEWPEWKSSFETLVHNEPSYTDTENFFYLRKSLQGVAGNLLKGW